MRGSILVSTLNATSRVPSDTIDADSASQPVHPPCLVASLGGTRRPTVWSRPGRREAKVSGRNLADVLVLRHDWEPCTTAVAAIKAS